MDVDLTIELAMLISSLGLVGATCGLVWYTKALVGVTSELNAIERRRDEEAKAARARLDLETAILYANQVIAVEEIGFAHKLTISRDISPSDDMTLRGLKLFTMRLGGSVSKELIKTLDDILAIMDNVMLKSTALPGPEAVKLRFEQMKGYLLTMRNEWSERLRTHYNR